MIKVCYVLSYRAPRYVRSEAIIQALEKIPGIELFIARNNKIGISRYLETFLKFIKIRIFENPDLYIIGFRGHEIYWLLKLFIIKKKIIFDEMMSPWSAFTGEKHGYPRNKLLSRVLYGIEKGILHDSDIVITDTEAHVDYLSKTFHLEKNRLKEVPVGTDENLFVPKKGTIKDTQGLANRPFMVFFYGNFLPLHGVEVILESAALLHDLPIVFLIVGGRGNARNLAMFNKKLADLKCQNVRHIEWVNPEQLPDLIAEADVCLGGPFGGTEQASRVVTGKTYQFLCMGKPTVIGKIDKMRPSFLNKNNCFIVEQRNSEELAEVLRWSFFNRSKLEIIGQNAEKLYWSEFSSIKNAVTFDEIIRNI